MRKYLIALVLIVAFLAILIPLASTNPDGLEKVVQTLGGNEQNGFWAGLMQDYSVASINNSYLSTLIAGITGVVLVFISAFILGRKLGPKKKKN
jgi:cobalt/nickel transport protein